MEKPKLPVRPSFLPPLVRKERKNDIYTHLRKLYEARDPDDEVRYTDSGLVILEAEEAIRHIETLKSTGQNCIIYCDSINTARDFFLKYASTESLRLGRELIMFEDYAAVLAKFGQEYCRDHYFVFVSINASILDPIESSQYWVDQDASGKRGWIVTHPRTQWIDMMTSNEGSSGILFFEKLASSTIEVQRWLRPIFEIKRPQIWQWPIMGNWQILSISLHPDKDFNLGISLKDRLAPFYLDI